MLSQSWELRNASTHIGTLAIIEINQPWFRCSFTPGDGWAEVKALFAAQAEAFDGGEEPVMREAVRAVKDLHLQLHPQEGGEAITPVMMHIRGNEANFRY